MDSMVVPWHGFYDWKFDQRNEIMQHKQELSDPVKLSSTCDVIVISLHFYIM
jgi:hypothetical protein